MTHETQIRRRPDGSIDTASYMALGRLRRGEAAHALTGKAARTARRPGFFLAALLALIPFLPGQN